MDFAIDRNVVKQPSLAEMTASALKVLSTAPNKGFVLFVENENTDTAGHDNDVGALMHELWAFDDAVKVALAFRKLHPETLVIVTGDHETGGFSPTSAQRPKGSAGPSASLVVNADMLRVIGGFKMSFQALSDRMDEKVKAGADQEAVMAYLADLVQKNLPGMQMDDEVRALILTKQAPSLNIRHHQLPPTPAPALGLMVARQTGFYWGSSGHTSEPATVSAIGPGAGLFRGYQDNTDFARNLRRLLGIQPDTTPTR
jgi:alkaline phosphatase